MLRKITPTKTKYKDLFPSDPWTDRLILGSCRVHHSVPALQQGFRLICSLFVYPHKVVLKTCGTTKLLLSIPRILELAAELSLPVLSVKYSRGMFIFPGAQPSPHRSFSEEVSLLNSFFGGLKSGGNAYVIGDAFKPRKMWHVYYAAEEPGQPMVTLEMCMTGLDVKKAAVFFKNSATGGCSSAKEMTKLSGISDIIPEMEICDFDFDPCGYSMNGICGPAASTIHVTPEEGFSYASYEAMDFNLSSLVYSDVIKRVSWQASARQTSQLLLLSSVGMVLPNHGQMVQMLLRTCATILWSRSFLVEVY
jgi:S-adenosylmethionine decarboxylase proenzyme